jgi:hypothetical protein
MPEISLDTRVRVSEAAIVRELDGEAVVLQLDDGVYFGLDPVGTRLWQLLEHHGLLRRAHDAALGEFDVTPDVLERDLIDLVRQLADRRLVELV